jgi:thiosulfate/3-mercaptopyruvate sulfurtransferase
VNRDRTAERSGAFGAEFAHPKLLWSPADLLARLQDPGLRILDVRVGEAYATGHIPGARHFSVYGVNAYNTDEATLESFLRMWAVLAGHRGIGGAETVLVCGEVAGMCAARAFWCLELLGHRDVHVLDGGLRAWVRAGLPLTHEAWLPEPAVLEVRMQRDRVATRRDLLAALVEPDHVLLDTRTRGEWLGEDARAARNGTIPGALHLYWGLHLTEDGRMRPAAVLRDLFQGRGVTPDKDIIALCNTGYRSAHTYLALRLLGYTRVRNYLGAWQEWGNCPECPVVVPDPAEDTGYEGDCPWETLSSSDRAWTKSSVPNPSANPS